MTLLFPSIAFVESTLPAVSEITVLQGGPSLQNTAVFRTLTRVLGLSLAGGIAAGGLAAVHRWYAAERMPTGLAVLTSLGVVAVYLNTTDALQAAMGDTRGIFDVIIVTINAGTFLVAAAVAPGGARTGDWVATELFTLGDERSVDGGVGHLVRAMGRVVTVELPSVADIEDVEGYDPLPPGKKAELANRTLVFPRGVTVSQLRERLVERLRSDFDVGHVDVEVTDDGRIEHLGVGSRAAGLGPTLPPGTAAIAIRADPAFGTSAGDRVQVWSPSTEDSSRNVVTATDKKPNTPPETSEQSKVDRPFRTERGRVGATDGMHGTGSRPPSDETPGENSDAGRLDGAQRSASEPATMADQRQQRSTDTRRGGPTRKATAEVRGRSGPIVTLALDEADAERLNDTTRYRLLTLPASPSADREFASLLRAADETMEVIEVSDDSSLVGMAVGALGPLVVAIRPSTGSVIPLPLWERTITAGDVVYVVGRPEGLRRLVTAATADPEQPTTTE